MNMHEASALAPDQPTGLGTAMTGAKGKLNLAKTERVALDYYPTPPECTRALMLAEWQAMASYPGTVWEPCGRGGAIARELHKFHVETVATDIVQDPANHVAQLDLLQARTALGRVVVTNPPFALAKPMIYHLLDRLDVDYLALMLKTTFFSTDTEGRGSLGLFRDHPPARRWDMTWRPDFTGGGGSTMNCSWFIWDRNATTPGQWGLLARNGPVRPERHDQFAKPPPTT